ncbi:hypothetical protein CR513_61355, partial [Mucuna pruriens]
MAVFSMQSGSRSNGAIDQIGPEKVGFGRHNGEMDDGVFSQKDSRVGVILQGPDGIMIEQSLHFKFKANNNQAEYEALLIEMRLTEEFGAYN